MQAEARRLSRVLQPYGVLRKDQLRLIARAASWHDGSFDAALRAAVASGEIEQLPFEFYRKVDRPSEAVSPTVTSAPRTIPASRSRNLLVVSLTGQVLRLHAAVYERSGGRIGHRMIGVPTLLLRTTGRRSGAIRTNALVYARDGDEYLLVASNGGADRPPAWLYNLQANPDIEIQIGRERHRGTARVVEPSAPEYERLWRLVNENNHDRYTGYQQKTTRPIPVIGITPS